MQNKVWQTMEQFHMCPYGGNIVVGVSGGADSVALLHILKGFAQGQNWSLTAIHVHHGLRGAEADHDRAFVEEICRKWGIPCKVYYFDVAKEAQMRGLGMEETGRLLRYQVFEKERNGGVIAVAHNKNDQAETILMRLCRGAGGSGLTGIRPVRDFIVRPLLFCTREEIEGYCEKNGLSYCQDSTNMENTYTRNRVRNQILPLLMEIYPKATAHIAQAAEIFAEEEEYLQGQAMELFSSAGEKVGNHEIRLNISALTNMHRVMQKRVFGIAFQKLGAKKDVTFVHFALLEGLLKQESGKSLHLPNKMIVQRNYDVITMKKDRVEGVGFCYSLPMGQEIFVAEANLFVRTWVCTEKSTEKNEDSCTKVFDYDKIGCAIFCRTRQKGDRLAVGNGRKKLKDFMIDDKIPRDERDRVPLIAFEDQILWVVGKRSSAAYQVDGATKRFLTVQIRRFVKE
ncbi:tRNA(Ile)-lysidine synthase [Anaerotignum neopropionicum]|uniref:tRNA(Ile)-lysidine synthase n=1 Tax=Anaerotignum neopropionicum TaxID=36847 RepID=A0A136WC75_9FIRM|nr:tRNA lysidine(34) synthetase TilS [Anaerotignum neopropionicum]KXL52046.1 tRNA(Ile)-lysidine synthase [Anaerotignum neopropionicum]